MKRKLQYLSGAFLLGLIYFVSTLELSLFTELLSPEKVAEILGPYGPAGIIAGQIGQVILAPIPPVTAVASGTLYGPFLGAFYSIIGATIGTVIAIYVSDRYGRPLVERFVSEENMNKFDELTKKTGYLPFIILFVLPGFPDDALCFIVGLTNLDWKKLAFIASIGRLPGILMLTTTGHSIAEANTLLFIVASASVLVVSTLSVSYRKQIEAITSQRLKAKPF
ncbi:MAG: VTT domain-containing protein [Candidatus Nanohaloarchaea archaeon]